MNIILFGGHDSLYARCSGSSRQSLWQGQIGPPPVCKSMSKKKQPSGQRSSFPSLFATSLPPSIHPSSLYGLRGLLRALCLGFFPRVLWHMHSLGVLLFMFLLFLKPAPHMYTYAFLLYAVEGRKITCMPWQSLMAHAGAPAEATCTSKSKPKTET